MAIDNRNPSPDLAPSPVGAGSAGQGADEVLRLDDLHVSVHDGAATAVRGVSLRVRAGAGTLVTVDPIIHIDPSLERADGDRQSQAVA